MADRDQIRRTYEQLVELEEQGATLDDIHGPEGYVKDTGVLRRRL